LKYDDPSATNHFSKGEFFMFDRLVESTNEKRHGRAGRIFLLTTLVYGMLLSGGVVATILGLNPALADALSVSAHLAPPPPPGDSAPQPSKMLATKAPTTASPTMVPNEPPPVATPQTIIQAINRPVVPLVGRNPCPGCGSVNGSPVGVPGITSPTEVPPPPPPAAVKPKPTPEPEPAPTPKPVLKVSQISPGLVLRRVSPQYPAMAKQIRLQGAVQVQVLISETGQVLSTGVVSGHPFLRAAAEEAARQWLFKPTTLNEVPVKVQGILTFNFTLN
jgi:periplasmic protein TonB